MTNNFQDKQKLLKLLLQKKGISLKTNTIPLRDKFQPVPLSFSQERFWFLYQLEDKGYTYNMPFRFQIDGNLDVEVLRQALETIMQRHEVLHTSFQEFDQIPLQIIHPDMTLDLPFVDLQPLSSAQQSQELARLTNEEIYTPFDLTQAPLMRPFVVKLRENSYILFLSLHHSVFDGWSMKVFLKELSTLYQAFLKQEANPLPDLPIQYGDFAVWQRQQLQGDKLTTKLNYWKQQLTEIPPLLEIPTDKPRPPIQTFQGNSCKFKINSELSQQIKTITQKSTATLNMTLLTAFNILLYRYSRQEDIVIGIPSGNRQFPEIEPLIGCFINTLPIRTQFKENLSFKSLLNQVKQVVLEAYEHQDLPLEKVVEAVNPERNMSYSPLFQVMFSWEDMLHIDNFSIADLKLTPVTMNALIAQFDLTLAMQETAEGLVGSFDYNCALFNQDTIERLAGNFVTLLEAIANNPQQPIAQLPLLTENQRKQILVDWNATETEYPKDLCLNQLFEKQVKQNPDAIAVVFENQSLTYQQLNIQANKLSHYLQSMGVKPETLVGIYLERSLSMIVALLAVLKAGGAYVPLDPDYPIQRLAYIAEDSQCSVLITQQTLLNSLPIPGVNVIVLDAETHVLTTQNSDNPVSEVKPKNLACLLYTSGSTGQPKGVMLTHEALVNHSSAISEVFGLTSCDRVLQFASLAFDVAAEEIFPTWLKGATVVLKPAQMFPDLASFANFIAEQKLTVLNITPAYWHEWAVAVSKSDATVPSSLRLIAVGGDAVLPETVTLWQQVETRHSTSVRNQVSCLNVYGPTEASVTAVVHDLLTPSEQINSVLIGRPIANTQIYILDRHLQPVPVGVIGELHIGGVRLARGYFNRPELTAEKFLPNPFKEGTKHHFDDAHCPRIYKTGDLARYLPDGNIECLGRIDNQIKIRGFRIELGEIEAVLNRNPHVQVSCVIVREDHPGDKRLVGYVVPHDQQHPPKISELRQFLSHHLPLYMVPSAFVFLANLPLTPNRKVDRRTLPAPDILHDQKDTYVAPRTPTEKIVADIWQNVLGLTRISIFDNFFELGGHSLKAAQVISRLREQLSINIYLNYLFSEPTVAGLSSNLDLNLSQKTPDQNDKIKDWQAEITLDPTIYPPNPADQFTQKPANILLTGATGFLGIHLLAELLDKTAANIYCLIRCNNLEQAQEKIYAKLKTFQLWHESTSHRIIPVIGDLSQKRLGICEPDFLELADKIDVIYHNGAWVNAIYPYSILKPANVLGTEEILRLACLTKTKPVHFVSTISVFSPTYAQGNLIQESDPLGIDHGLNAGYTQSKWVAEKLIMEARQRGLPVTIFRASRIIGHSKTGICNTEDLFCRMIKGCIQLGMNPDFGDSTEDLTPVDYVSGAIVHLASQENSLGKAFHLLNPHPTLNCDLFNCIREMGYPLQSVSFEKWRLHLTEQCKISNDNALYTVLENFSDDNLFAGELAEFDYKNTLMGLKGTDFNFLPINQNVLTVYFDYFTKNGFLDKPRELKFFEKV